MTSTAGNIVTMLLLPVFSLLVFALSSVYAQASSDEASELAALSAALPPCGVRLHRLIRRQDIQTLTDSFLIAEMFHHRIVEFDLYRCGVCV